MRIPASAIRELREKTGAGVMDCKRALEETQGDMEKAATLLRKKGLGPPFTEEELKAMEEAVREELKAMYQAIPAEKKRPALDMLRSELSEIREELLALMQADPETWWAGHHHEWGMGVRNMLRLSGYGEDYFGVDNLDDIYVALVEEALKGN